MTLVHIDFPKTLLHKNSGTPNMNALPFYLKPRHFPPAYRDPLIDRSRCLQSKTGSLSPSLSLSLPLVHKNSALSSSVMGSPSPRLPLSGPVSGTHLGQSWLMYPEVPWGFQSGGIGAYSLTMSTNTWYCLSIKKYTPVAKWPCRPYPYV